MSHVDAALEARLHARASARGRSEEEDALSILAAALRSADAESKSLVNAVRERVEPIGGVELQVERR